ISTSTASDRWSSTRAGVRGSQRENGCIDNRDLPLRLRLLRAAGHRVYANPKHGVRPLECSGTIPANQATAAFTDFSRLRSAIVSSTWRVYLVSMQLHFASGAEPMTEPWASVDDLAKHLGVAKDSI